MMPKFQVSSFKFQVSKTGFTILETLVALSLIVAALVGPVALITRGLAATSISKNKLIAANLAQEGIELGRAIRENNILCGHVGELDALWNTDPTFAEAGDFGQTIRPGAYTLDVKSSATLSCNGNAIKTPRLGGLCDARLKLGADGAYTYIGSAADSQFSRCVKICTPPADAPCSGPADPDIDANHQMEIISEVKWNERGIPRAMELRERLYNWE